MFPLIRPLLLHDCDSRDMRNVLPTINCIHMVQISRFITRGINLIESQVDSIGNDPDEFYICGTRNPIALRRYYRERRALRRWRCLKCYTPQPFEDERVQRQWIAALCVHGAEPCSAKRERGEYLWVRGRCRSERSRDTTREAGSALGSAVTATWWCSARVPTRGR